MQDKIAYIFDETLRKECDRLPTVLKRVSGFYLIFWLCFHLPLKD